MPHEHEVLVMTEEPEDRRRYATALGDAALHGAAVSSTEGRLRLEAGVRPCLVVIDENLGRLSWGDVHRLCRGGPDGRPVPVVLVARHATALEAARHLGFGVLPIPLDPWALRRLVTTVCAARRNAPLSRAADRAPASR